MSAAAESLDFIETVPARDFFFIYFIFWLLVSTETLSFFRHVAVVSPPPYSFSSSSCPLQCVFTSESDLLFACRISFFVHALLHLTIQNPIWHINMIYILGTMLLRKTAVTPISRHCAWFKLLKN